MTATFSRLAMFVHSKIYQINLYGKRMTFLCKQFVWLLHRFLLLISKVHVLQYRNVRQLYLSLKKVKIYMIHLTYPIIFADTSILLKINNFTLLIYFYNKSTAKNIAVDFN